MKISSIPKLHILSVALYVYFLSLKILCHFHVIIFIIKNTNRYCKGGFLVISLHRVYAP